jgi:hypothetical protein
MQLGYIGEAEWCPEAAEAMPSSRGDARAAERAHIPGAIASCVGFEGFYVHGLDPHWERQKLGFTGLRAS